MERSNEALRAAALAVSSAGGTDVFGELARLLAGCLGVRAAMISVFADGGAGAASGRMRTLATWVEGKRLKDFEYDLQRTPCAGVVGREFRYVGSGGAEEFAPGTMFRAKGFDCYAAYSLNDAAGTQRGLIAVMDRGALPERELTEATLKIFAMRAAAEIERKSADEALVASEAQYRAIFNASADALVLWDSQLRRVDVNPAYERVYGWKREEVIGRGFAQVMPPENVVHGEALVRRSLAGETCHAEFVSVRKSGERFAAEVTTIPFMHRGEPHVLAIARDVTARKSAEAALRASEEQYRAIFNASADAMVLWDSQLRRVDVNAAYERMFGWTREQVLGHARLNDGTTPEYAERRLELVRRALAGESGHAELEAVRKSGERLLVDVSAIPFRQGDAQQVLVTLRDVTERRRAEAALRASESQYRAIFNAAADSMVLRDADFRVVDVNPAYEAMSGRPRAEALGRNNLTMSPPELTERVRGLHARALEGEPVMFEARARRKNGEQFDIETRGVPILHEGRPHVLYIGRDITARKRAEELLRASEEQYRAIFNAAADALVLRDADFRIVDVNPAYEAMSGYARSEVLGRDRVVANPPEMEAEIRALHARALAGEPVMLETIRVRKDGTRHDVELRGVPIRHRGAPHVLYIGRDISERKAMESRLRQAHRMEALGQLTGGVAHDFNNLLASIMGYVVLASERESAQADPKLAAHLEQSLASCRRARDLVQQMLTFSRGQRGTPRPVALAEAVGGSLKLLRSSVPATVEIDAALEPGAPPVLLDSVQLDQILLNLSINARDAMGGVGRIELAVRPWALRAKATCASCRKRFRGEYVELAVSDSGPGIAPRVLERMFEPFFTTKEVGRGSGMGLATVHGIVHEHGGHVIVETEQGKGSRFRVLLPKPAPQIAAPQAPVPAGATRPRAPLRGRVLVVDDEEPVASFMRELLESWGLQATALNRPLGVMERISREPRAYDLVILDQTMPGITGLSLARELYAARPELPVLLYTGHSERLNAADLASAGVRALFHKPVEPELLYGLLKANLPEKGS